MCGRHHCRVALHAHTVCKASTAQYNTVDKIATRHVDNQDTGPIRGGRYLQKQILILFCHNISITTNIAMCLLDNS